MKTLSRLLVLVPSVVALLCVATIATAQGSTNSDAVVLVNSSSASYSDFDEYVRGYLDHFGVPFTVIDIATTAVGPDIGDYAAIIVGHRVLDAPPGYLDAGEGTNISNAVSAGTGLINFDNYLSADGSTGLYQFVQDIFGFGYGAATSGSGVSFPSPGGHYITDRHDPGESIGVGSMTLPGIASLGAGVTEIVTTAGQPFLTVATHGAGRAVQWSSYDWMSHSVHGPVYGLDDLVWRSVVWSARKPFAMQGMPPFLTMRVDDESGNFEWIHIANEFGIKPWAGLFFHNIDATEAADLSSLTNSGMATAAIHAFSGSFFYYNHGVGDWPDSQMAAHYAEGTAWHVDNNIPIADFVLPHYYEFGSNAFQGLSDWGVEFVGTMMDPGNGYGASWAMNGPFRLYESGSSSAGWPVFYADFMTIPGHPEFDGQFFNCVTEIRDDAGYEWYPNLGDVAGSIGRGTRQSKRALDSMALATLFTHGYYVSGNWSPTNAENWRAILDGITTNLQEYDLTFPTMDDACRYVRATRTSEITASTYDPTANSLTTTFGGQTDMPTMFYVFMEVGGSITHVLVDVPAFAGSTNVVYALPGPLDYIVVAPNPASVVAGATQQFSAEGYDADDNPIPNLSFDWSVIGGGGTIDANGLFTAGITPGTYADTVLASRDGVDGYATVEVTTPVIDHLEFEPVSSPKYVDLPFSVTISARDAASNLVVGYAGSAALSDTTGTVSPTATGAFVGGVWTGQVTLSQEATGVVLSATDGAVTGDSNPFDVAAVGECPCSIWDDSFVPGTPWNNDPNPLEIGVKFRAGTDGYVTALRFYKGSGNTGLHVGHLWAADGTLLAEATFTDETAEGWQEVALAEPVAIQADTTYVASYHSPTGYAADRPYFGTAYDNPPLRALADGEDGGNGVYKYDSDAGSLPALPDQTYQSSNYWVDVVFVTEAAPPSDEGPGGPILVIADAGNLFGRYIGEILLTEGLNAFTVTDILSVDATRLAAYDVVVLGEMALTVDQVTMLTDWVDAGGNLIAMRPDSQLSGLLGLSPIGGTLSDGYLLVDTASGPGTGIVAETVQFHGTADLYDAYAATTLATLYSDAATPTAHPAVTIKSVGVNGGQAAAFTYDLARSVVYTRQGNPAWIGDERDGVPPLRPDDLFFGAMAGDVQPDWIDLDKVAIPQADEQQRLLANLILDMNLDRMPLPRFWYFPRGEKAVVIMTGDDHGQAYTAARLEWYDESLSPVGCSVEDWECVRSSSYLYPNATLSLADSTHYDGLGFEIGLHVNTGCNNWTPTSLDSDYASQFADWQTSWPSLPVPVSERTHCIAWSDWVTHAEVELSYGSRLDTNYYYWPPSWILDRPGMFTGSGMLMRFADVDGRRIDVFQAVTQMTDESGQSYPYTIDTLLDRALGAEGYYGAFTANMHINGATHSGAAAIVSSAQTRDVPVVSGRQMLEWLDGRNASSFGALAWNGTTLSFTVAAGTGARGLEGMVPTHSDAGVLTGMTHDGSPITYRTETIKGVEYAIFDASAGAYQAVYGVDTVPPVISSVGADPVTDTTATITWITDEDADSLVEYGLDPGSLTLSEFDATLAQSHVVELTGLAPDTDYYFRVSSADEDANSATSAIAQFTTLPAQLVDADFQGGTGTCAVVQTGDGDLILAPTAGDEFEGTVLPAGWSSTPWTGGVGTSLSGGVATVDGALLATDAYYGPGRSIEFVATFTGNGTGGSQHVGFGTDLNGAPWAIFSTGYPGGSTILARSNGTSAINTDTLIPVGSSHRFRIEWLATEVVFYVDGAEVARHAATITGNMRPVASDLAGGGTLTLDWIRMSPYGEPTQACTFDSAVLDAGDTVDWGTMSWTSEVPTGTTLALSYRTGDTATPDGSWSAWTAAGASPAALGGSSRYIQYRAELSTADDTLTPTLQDVTITYSIPVPVVPYYTVTSASYDQAVGVPFVVTVTAYQGETINCWEDDHQDPVLVTTSNVPDLIETDGQWTEFLYTPSRPYPTILAGVNEESYGLPVMRFYATGIPTGQYEVVANLYDNAPMRYFYGFTPGDPKALSVDVPGGATGTQHREYSLGTVSVSGGVFNLYVQDADILPGGSTYPFFGWAWIRLVPVEEEVRIDCWEDGNQDPVLATTTVVADLVETDGQWTEFLYTSSRPYPTILAGVNEESSGLPVMRFYATGIPAGEYEIVANLYTSGAGRDMRYYYGFTLADPKALYVDTIGGTGGTEQHTEYSLGTATITDGTFDLYVRDADLTGTGTYPFFGWAWIRLVPTDSAITMTSDSPTMLFDGDGDGIFGEPGDELDVLIGGTLDIDARETAAGTNVEIRAEDSLGRFGFNLYNIISVNAPPVANDDTDTTDEDALVTIDVAANDTDVDGNLDPTTANVACGTCSSTSNGALVNNGDGTFDYTPAPDFNGGDSFVYEICDTGGLCDTATVTITVNPVNDAPVAADDSATTPEDTAVDIAVLGNDTDVDGDTLSVGAVTDPPNGTATINPDNTVNYQPDADFCGQDSFGYTASDGAGGEDSATVTVDVTCVNDAPDAVDDTATTDEDVPVTTDVLANDSDLDGDAIAVGSWTQGANGAVSCSTTDCTYTPNPNYNGTDSYTYDACDPGGLCDTATVNVTINAVNDAPDAVDDTATTDEDVPVTTDVLANDSDLDGDAIAVGSWTQGANGAVSCSTTDCTYTPNPNYNGTDSYTYDACDPGGLCDTATVNVTINAVNDAPDAVDDTATTDEDVPVTTDVLANDSDLDGDAIAVGSWTQGANGAVSCSTTDCTYTPNPNYNGTDSYTYDACDPGGLCDTATVNVTINAVNDAPDAVDDTATTDEDVPVTTDVLANDSDLDGDAIAVGSWTQGANGAVSCSTTDCTYTPNPNYNGTDSYTYDACDPGGLCDTATVNVTINAVNDAPDAVDDTATTDEDVPVTTDVLANDSDLDGDAIAVGSWTQGANGAVSCSTTDCTYTPNPNYNGTDSYTYDACDPGGLCDTATVNVTINAVNDAPDAVDDTATTDEDVPVTTDVLANDSDLDGDAIAVGSWTQGANGAVSCSTTDCTYTPNPNYNGTDSYTYDACDPGGLCDTATVNVTINAVNDAPDAVDDTATTDEDVPVTTDVLANDSDLDGDAIAVGSWTQGANGAVSCSTTDCTYTPNPNYNGTDSYTYDACDPGGLCDTATVNVTINAVNDAPDAVDDTATTDEDVPVTTDVLANDSDLDGDAIAVGSWTQGANGAVSCSTTDCTYTPNPNYNGTDSYTYDACDPGGLCDTATVNVTINAVNDAPDAVDDTATTDEDVPVTTDVLANDSDLDGDAIAVGSWTQGANGAVSCSTTDCTYTPNPNYNGTDSYTYDACDPGGLCDTATVNVTINAVNDAPDAVDDTATTDEDVPVTTDVLANDSDLDGDAIAVGSWTQGANGAVSCSTTDCTYTPNPNYNGTDSYTYDACDPGGLCDTATVNVTINAVNDAPDAVDDTATTDEDVPVTTDVLANDSDLDGDAIAVGSWTQGANGAVSCSTTDCTYTPNPNYNGTDSYTYDACDPGGLCDTATVNVTINAVNDAPDAVDDTATTDEDVPVTTDVLANDSDLDGDAIAVGSWTQGANGAVSCSTTDCTYTPNPNYNGTDSYTYDACDPGGLCDTATVNVTINAVNDAPDAVDDTATTDEDVPVTTDVLANDSDLDGDAIAVGSWTQGANGAVSCSTTDCTYTPNPNYNGTDSYTYDACDPGGLCDTATVNVTINAVNDAPDAVDDTATTDEDVPVTTDVLANDSDLDGDAIAVGSWTQGANGAVSCSTTDCTYTPNPNYNGTDSYTYDACDPGGLCDTATVNVTINAVNDAPVAGDDAYATDEDTALNVAAPGVLDNDSDVDGDALTVSEVNGNPASVGQQIALTSGALVTLNATGSFEYNPNGQFEHLAVGTQGLDTYTYTVSDGNGGTDTATVSITITGVNDAPVAHEDTYGTDENTLLTIPAALGVLENDSDVDGDALSVSEVNSSPANVGVQITLGSGALLTVGSDGGFTYDPNGQFEYLAGGVLAEDWFIYTVSDGNGGTDTEQVKIRILGVNDAPVMVSVEPASQTVQYSDGIVPVTVVATDIDTPAMTISPVDVPTDLAFSDASCVAYGPSGSQCTWQLSGNVAVPAATYTATFTVGDGAGGTATDSATITVEVEDAAIDFDDDNAQAVLVDTPGGDSGPFQLVVHVTERVPDADTDPGGDSLAFPGDIGLAQVSMTLTPVGPGSTVSDDCDLRTVSGTGYDAILTVTCDFTGIEVNTYTIEVTVDGDYYSGYSEDVVTIYDPSLGFTTGGGWFYWPGTADPRTGYPGDRTNFGYTMRYNNQGRNLRGSLLVIRHLPDDTIYRIKSNALQGLSLGIETDSDTGETFGWASFTGKATYLEPGWPEPIGNHRFIAYVEDHNEPGTGTDRFWLETRDKQRNVIPVMSMATPAQDNAVPLQGGNIVAPHGDSAQSEAGPDGVILSTSEPDSIFGR